MADRTNDRRRREPTGTLSQFDGRGAIRGGGRSDVGEGPGALAQGATCASCLR